VKLPRPGLSENERFVVVATSVPLRKTRYEATPDCGSVAAVQLRPAFFPFLAAESVNAVGEVVSTSGCVVAVALAAGPRFVAASSARTW
jgi:hypothetical protein